MYKFPIYWTEKLKIDFLQRVILIHSYLYYETDNTLWSDKQYDSVARQLVELQSNKTKAWIKRKTQYGYCFYDFDGTTGFDLWDRLQEKDKKRIQDISCSVLI